MQGTGWLCYPLLVPLRAHSPSLQRPLLMRHHTLYHAPPPSRPHRIGLLMGSRFKDGQMLAVFQVAWIYLGS